MTARGVGVVGLHVDDDLVAVGAIGAPSSILSRVKPRNSPGEAVDDRGQVVHRRRVHRALVCRAKYPLQFLCTCKYASTLVPYRGTIIRDGVRSMNSESEYRIPIPVQSFMRDSFD
eukprot:COSAG02_NODE_493_length_21166_cov_13.181318_11_plen_116_part_00